MADAPTPEQARAAATTIVRTLVEAGHAAYFAGGCVRDELLGLDPTDYDVATDATPDRIGALFRHTHAVGASFGVVLVRVGSAKVEVATFRSDGPYTDRRRPDSITFSDPQSDALRRDFTINALFLDPLAQGADPGVRGRVIDHVNGRADLGARIIRAVGNPEHRLAEDHLRALRAVRFAARLGFTIEQGTAHAIRVHATDLAGVSRERIGEEVRRMVRHPSRAKAVALLDQLALTAPVVGIAENWRLESKVAITGLPADAPVPLALAAWALDLYAGRAQPIAGLVSTWRSGLALSNDESDAMRDILICYQALISEWKGLGVAGQKRRAASSGFGEAVVLLRACQPSLALEIQARIEELAATPSGIAPSPLVTGDDLARLGLAPGPRYKAILNTLYDAQLEDRARTREQAMELARQLCV